MAFSQKLFTSLHSYDDSDTRIGELNRIWYDSINNVFRIQLDKTTPGGTIIGGGSGTGYTLPTASTTILGGVKIDGTTITINNGVIKANYTQYTLPTASQTTLGGVKVDGTTITINGSGVISSVGTGSVIFKGTWNASTNSPQLTATTAGAEFAQAGWEYLVSTPGTRDIGSGSQTFYAGDLVIYDGVKWNIIPGNAGSVVSFNTRTGVVTLTSTDVTTALGYTPIQLSSLSVQTASASGGGALTYNNTTGLFTFTPADVATANAIPAATMEPMGHADKSQSTISFNDSTRTFTISPVSGSYNVWVKGVKFVISTTRTVTIPNTSGLYYIYFDAAGALQYQTTYFDWPNQAPTAYVYWNSGTGKAPMVADERHGIVLDWQTHEYLHRTRGAAIANGFGASNYILNGAGNLNTHIQLDIASGTFFDEDLEVNVVSTNTPTANTWEQDLTGPSQIPIFYLSGTTGWVRDNPTTFPLKRGSVRPVCNLNTAGTWSTPDIDNNKFGVTFIIATNNINYPVMGIIGQSQHANQSDAEAVNWSDLDLTGFPIVEFRPLYKVVYQTKTSFSNTPKAIIVSLWDLRSFSSVTSSAASFIDANALGGTTLAPAVVNSSLTSVGTIATGTWQATPITNTYLANSSVTINGTSINLGSSGTVTASAGTLTGTTLNSTVVTSSLTSVGTLGSLTVQGGTGTYYAASFKGSTGGDQFAIGLSSTAGYGAGNDVLNSAGTAYAPYTISASTMTFKTGSSVPATAFSIDISGNITFNNTVTGSITGNAATATKLATARNINGVAFDGSAAITVTADATTLTGATLKSTVVNSSLTSVGTLTSLTSAGTVIFTDTTNSTNTTTGALQVRGGVGVAGNIYLGGGINATGSIYSAGVNVTYAPVNPTGQAFQATGKDTQGGTGYFDFLKTTNTTSGVTNGSKTFRLNSTGAVEIINSAYSATLFNLSDIGNLSISGDYQVGGKKAVNGPAFRAYVSTGQTISSGSQLTVTFGAENFDTDNCFTGNTFTPTIEGYYQFNATVRIDGSASTGEIMIVLYKNANEYARGTNEGGTEQGANWYSMQVSDIAYANGTTDSFHIRIQQTSGSNKTTTAGSTISYFSGCMIRGA